MMDGDRDDGDNAFYMIVNFRFPLSKVKSVLGVIINTVFNATHRLRCWLFQIYR